ncbi:MAG: DnaJ domain-containing protein [Candidatus Hodarchaeales archaeon]
MGKKDYYDVLGVSRTANLSDIKKAYRKGALKYHPDRAKDSGLEPKVAEDKFKEISEAYTILSDPEKKKQYDMFGHDAFSQFGRGGGVRMDIDPFEIFSQFFGQRGGNSFFSSFQSGRSPFSGGQAFHANQGPQRGSDVKVQLKINLSDLEGRKTSLKKNVNLKKKFHDGTVKKERIRISIPRFVKDGQILRISGKGNPGKRGGLAGDLLAEILLNDDILEIPVSIFLAIRGSEFTVQLPDGKKFTGNIPENTIENSILTFTGMNNEKKVVRVKYKYPSDLTKKQKELLNELCESEKLN